MKEDKQDYELININQYLLDFLVWNFKKQYATWLKKQNRKG